MKGLWKAKLDFIEDGKHSYRDRRKKVTAKQFVKDNFQHYTKHRTKPLITNTIVHMYEAIVQYRTEVINSKKIDRLIVYKTKKINFSSLEDLREKVINDLKAYIIPNAEDIQVISLSKVGEKIYRKKSLDYIPNFDFSYIFSPSERVKRQVNSCKSKKRFKSFQNRKFRRIFKEKLYVLKEDYEEVKYKKKYRMSSLKKVSKWWVRIYQR